MQTNSGKKPALTFVAVFIAALIVCVAIFVRPREQVRTLSNPDKLMANASVAGIWDTSFADKVMRTVFFALILNRDEYSAQNADAMEALRSWAAKNFHSDPRFLHPVVLPTPVSNSTFVNATAYSLLAAPYYGASSLACDFLSARIEHFSKSRAFNTFAANAYDFFGKEPQTALMLSRYQSDRAKAAVNPLLSLLYGVLALVMTPLFLPRLARAARWWRSPVDPDCNVNLVSVFTYACTCVAGFYLAQSIVIESLAGQSLLAMVVSAGLGLFVLFPVKIFVDTQNVLCLRASLSQRAVVAISFVFGSLLIVQMLNWLKQGSVVSPDPLTLIIASFAGDFVHEPTQAKRTLATMLSIVWAIGFASVLKVMIRRDGVSSREVAKRLAEGASRL